jgi:hypothetical protein
MALSKTPTEVILDWLNLRDNYLPLLQNEGLSSSALQVALAFTEAGGGGAGGVGPSATESTLAAILAQIKSDRAIASQLFTDATGAAYLRVLAYNQETNAYESATLTLAGAPYTPTLPETPLVKSDLDTTETSWSIVTAGTGYSVGDVVSQYTFLSQSPPTVVATLWFNQSTQLAISAPLAGHRRRTDGLAATDATLATRALESGGNLSAILAKLSADPATQTTVASILTQLQNDRDISSHLYRDSTGKIYSRTIAFNQTSSTYEIRVLDISTNPATTYVPVLPETPITQIFDVVLNTENTATNTFLANGLLGSTSSSVAPATDTATANLNGRLQKVAQNITALTTVTANAGKATAADIGTVTTSATGATFVALAVGACTEVVLNNTALTSVDIEYQRGGAGAAMLVPAGAIAVVEAISNTSNIGVRRADQSNTPSTFGFERKTR